MNRPNTESHNPFVSPDGGNNDASVSIAARVMQSPFGAAYNA